MAAELLDLHAGDAFLLALKLGAQGVVLLLLLHIFFVSVFVLLSNKLGLLCFFFFMHYNSVLNFLLLSLSLLLHLEDPLAVHLLLLLLHVHLGHLLLLLGVVFLLEFDDLVGAPLGLLDLFPRFHFFLLQQGDSVGKQLGVSLHTTGSGQSIHLLFSLLSSHEYGLILVHRGEGALPSDLVPTLACPRLFARFWLMSGSFTSLILNF